MKHGCPNQNCNYHKKRTFIVKDGTFKRSSDSRIIQRYKCKICKTRFSSATFSLAKHQNKRRLNNDVYKHYCSNTSIRRIALLLKTSRKTVERKIEFHSKKAKKRQEKRLKQLEKNPLSKVQFDDLITIEHTKLKPLSASIAVCPLTRRILAIEVARIPAFGHLAEKSRKKYGKRKSEHFKKLNEMLFKLKPIVTKDVIFETDEHPLYPKAISLNFPQAIHKQYKGGRGCVVGQGELKRLKFDPLFSLNHTYAMLRYSINRLVRKSWCTTKDPKKLEEHLNIYMDYHNEHLIKSAPG
ncbi:hypothetical protein HBN50_07200 [Halobacteriovorax sp. GB3]|uniref:hypothetical protein n=1 Tax=Halobacteriovorax sp. GB3 TaxID=2719615 RepID=UPI0023614600|nr:hypothetical protein [Halobacteriovorax sp. GB3]MDD0852875.1 hypothetical protein [Halobacteriovorax sp. GB3]